METMEKKTKEKLPKPKIRYFSSDEDSLLVNYFKEIGQINLISKDREAELSKRIQKGDEDALNELVNANLRFVVKIAKRYMNRGIPLQDLISEGNIGLIQAAKKFDYARGCSFTTYAVWYIRQSIAKAVTQFNCIVNIPKKQQVLLRKLETLLDSSSELSFTDATDELELDTLQFSQIYNLKNGLLTIDSSATQSINEKTYAEMLKDSRQQSPEEKYMDSSLQLILHDLLEQLEPREQKIIILKFGLDGFPPRTLKEIASKLNFSRERVRQIKLRALEKLRKLAKNYTLRAFLNDN